MIQHVLTEMGSPESRFSLPCRFLIQTLPLRLWVKDVMENIRKVIDGSVAMKAVNAQLSMLVPVGIDNVICFSL